MNVLGDYEAASGQKINKEKSFFYMHEKAPADEVNIVYLITKFQRQSFPFTYLGCPIFYSRKKKDFYKSIIFKVQERLSSWKGKLLSIGGRAVLIAHMLESMPIHLLSVVNPPNVLRALYHASGPDHWCDESIKYVDDVMENGAWNEELLRELLLEELADHILDSITPPSDYSMNDRPWWKLKTKGQFIVKSAWQYIRKKRYKSKLYMFFWVKGVPFKKSFFMWRMWKAKLPQDVGVAGTLKKRHCLMSF
ncbi:uncharacterized protein [Nicotiana tomentosiformis]|uniref:uncharacterized protein n=1 Tax=Nicotiana tomentosiformis TaxID=4098 RepID=UPI00388C9743